MKTPIRRVHQIADATLVTPDTIVRLLALSQSRRSTRILETMRATGLPKSALRLIGASNGDLFQVVGDRFEFTDAGHALAIELSSHLEVRQRQIADRAKLAEQVLDAIETERTRSNRRIDQFRATSRTSVARALLLEKHYRLECRRIAFLGDNDLTSVAVGILGGADELVVFDIDHAALTCITEFSRRAGFSTHCVFYDARHPLPPSVTKHFDVVVTDPPYTRNGVRLFVSRAGQMLVPNGGVIFLSFGSSLRARERELEIQRLLAEDGWLTHGLWPDFNEYYAAGSIGSRSNLYMLLSTPRVVVPVPLAYNGPIYTNQPGANPTRRSARMDE